MKRGTLTWRVLLVLALATVTPTCVVGYLAIRRARADLEREVVRGNLALIRALGASVDGTLQSARRALDLAATSWADERTATGEDDEGTRRSTARLLRRLRREVPLFASISIVGVDGRVLYGDPIAASDELGAHTFGGYIGDVMYDGDRPQVRVVSQARSRTGELVGVFVAQMDLRFVSDALGTSRLGQGARLLVVDGDGIPVARSDGVPLAGATSLRGENPAVDLALGSATEGNIEAGGMVAVYRNLSSYQTLRGVRWAIILEQPTEDAYALAAKTTRDTVVAGLAVLGIALVFGFLLATRLTRPLRALAARADAIAHEEGEPDDAPPAPVDAMGEIGHLAQRIEEMARRIGEREQLQAALARGDRLSTVGTMSASVAHEINNPLTTVMGYAALLLEDKDADHPDRSSLELIGEEAARMKKIVGALLDYSRSEASLKGGPADVNPLLERTVALLLPALRKGRIEVTLDLAEHLPKAAADPHELQQIFVNLAANAGQAMDKGGALTVASRLADDLSIEVTFTDQGPGVPDGLRETIFEPFFTTKEAGTGTGLGLAVCRYLVQKFRGRIGVEAGPGGVGARFHVVIPIQE